MVKLLIEIGRDIKLAHTIFAAPFAILAAFLAAGEFPGFPKLVLIGWCMFFARTFAMLSNRYFDRHIDGENPRTASRAIPAGRLKPQTVRNIMAICAVAFALGASGFWFLFQNFLPVVFTPVVLLWLMGYALAKRYTLLCHFILGAALAMSPLAAALAVNPDYLQRPTLWLLAGFVMLWVGGFDVIYALQDEQFDRDSGLHSIPAKLGEYPALLTAKVAHLVALFLLVGVYRVEPLLHRYTFVPGSQVGLFLLATVAVALLLIYEHRAASAGKFSMAFFTLNGIISVILGATGIAEVLLAS